MLAHRGEVAEHWSQMLRQPDQRETLAALHRTGMIARKYGMTRSQLARLIAPALRPWNASLQPYPDLFPLVKLVEAPEHVERPIDDDEARRLLWIGLSRRNRIALGSGSCAFNASSTAIGEHYSEVLAKSLTSERVVQTSPGVFSTGEEPGLLRIEFDPTTGARFLNLPGLRTNQELVIGPRDGQGRWRPAQYVHVMPPTGGNDGALIDLRSLIHWWGEPISALAIHFTRPGEIALSGLPRLIR
jgi:hypothetical protein